MLDFGLEGSVVVLKSGVTGLEIFDAFLLAFAEGTLPGVVLAAVFDYTCRIVIRCSVLCFPLVLLWCKVVFLFAAAPRSTLRIFRRDVDIIEVLVRLDGRVWY